ncbi:MAG: hypothetical protein JNL74_06150 [Fibrobacteres bacterium]|nr:hypothetical protein [Fibrobacterota bacterium]
MICSKNGMLKTISLLLLLSVSVLHAYKAVWDFSSFSPFVTNYPSKCYQIDTSYTDLGGLTINGVYKVSNTNGDSGYANINLKNSGFPVTHQYDFQFLTEFTIQAMSLYSMQFVGFTDTTSNVPIENTSANGMGLIIGRLYNGHVIGFVGNSRYENKIDTIMKSSMLTVGRTYRCSFYYSYYSYTMQIVRLPELTSVFSRNGTFYSEKNFTNFTVGNKGYNSLNGTGVAKQALLLDFVSVSRDSFSSTTNIKRSTINSNYVSIAASPNPLQSTTEILLNLPSSSLSKCHLMVYSSKGECVADLSEKIRKSNAVTITYNMANLPAGVYCAVLTGPFKKQTLRLVHVK